MIQETIEQASFRLYPKVISDPYNPSEDLAKNDRDNFIYGAKWQAERSYEPFKKTNNMTSVEWLIEQLQAPCRGIPTHIIDKANEMHQQEVENAATWGALYQSGEQYYQETFQNK